MLNSVWVEEQRERHNNFLASILPRFGVTSLDELHRRPGAAAASSLREQVAAEHAKFETMVQEWDIKAALGETDYRRIACRDLEEGEVRFEPVICAKSALVSCREDLRLGPLRIKWFAALDDEDRHEYREHLRQHGSPPWRTWMTDAETPDIGLYLTYQPDELRVKVSGDARQLIFVVAHEARHAWQQQEFGTPATRITAQFGGDLEAEKTWSERDADEYAQGVLAAFGHR